MGKSNIKYIIIFIFLAGVLAGCRNKPENEANIYVNNLGLKETIIARRGYWGKYPESTMIGFSKAQEIGAKLSADVLLTKDLQWVMLHDSNLNRLYCVDKSVYDLTYDELKKLSYCGPNKIGNNIEAIPLLKDYLDKFGSQTAEVEIKNLPITAAAEVEAKIEELIIMSQNYLDSIYFTSFIYDYIRLIKKINPAVKTGLVVYSVTDLKINLEKDLNNIDLFTVRESIIDDNIYGLLKTTGKKIWFYDMGEKLSNRRIQELAKYPADGYVVSYPIEFSQALLKFKKD